MTTTPIDQPNLRTDAHRSGDVKATIIIPIVQNGIGGLAVGILACIVLYPLGILRPDTTAAAFAGGLAVACAVTIFRFFADDVGIMAWARRGGERAGVVATEERLQPLLDQALSELEAERTRHRDTKRERDEFDLRLRSIRATGKYVHGESTEDPIRMDAERLINEWARRSYEPPTQRLMAEAGWTPQRYTMALAYLGSRNVIDRNGTKPKWLVDTKSEAFALLEID